jgi:transcription elongation factor Elf1
MKWYRYQCPGCGIVDSSLHKRETLEANCVNCGQVTLIQEKEGKE